jgi:hypothetical protein
MVDPGMLNTLQGIIHALFLGILNATSAGAMALFDASVVAAMVFYVWSIVRALIVGGGASLLETAAFRMLIMLALTALVTYWPQMVVAVEADILTFAAHIAAIQPGNAGLTPDGIITAHNDIINAVNKAGTGHAFVTQVVMNLWKLVSILALIIGGIGLSLALWFANISLDIVMAGCAVLIGFVVSPWLQSYAMQYIGIIVGTAVFIILVAIFVGLDHTLGLLELGVLNAVPTGAGPGQVLSGPTMLEMGVLDILFMVLAWVVPTWVAEKIAGGPPIIQVGNLLAAAQKGYATVRSAF